MPISQTFTDDPTYIYILYVCILSLLVFLLNCLMFFGGCVPRLKLFKVIPGPGEHSFELGEGKTGGIMDYGDGQLQLGNLDALPRFPWE